MGNKYIVCVEAADGEKIISIINQCNNKIIARYIASMNLAETIAHLLNNNTIKTC